MKTLQNCRYSTEKKELQKLFLQTLKRYTGFSTKDETVEKLYCLFSEIHNSFQLITLYFLFQIIKLPESEFKEF